MLNDVRRFQNRSDRIDVDELDLESQGAEYFDWRLKIGPRQVPVLFVVVSGNQNDRDAVRGHLDRLPQHTVQMYPEAPIDSSVSIEREQLIREEQRREIYRMRARKPMQVEMIRDAVPIIAFQLLDGLMQRSVVNPPLRIAFYVVPRRVGVDRRVKFKVVKTSRAGIDAGSTDQTAKAIRPTTRKSTVAARGRSLLFIKAACPYRDPIQSNNYRTGLLLRSSAVLRKGCSSATCWRLTAVLRLGRRGDPATVCNWLNGHELPSSLWLAAFPPVAQLDSAQSF